MKTKNLFLLGFVALALSLGFTSCDKDETPEKEKDANTHISVSLKMSRSNSNAPSKALPNDYNFLDTWGGKDLVEEVTIFLIDGTQVQTYNYEVGGIADGKDYVLEEVGGNLKITPTVNAAIKTTAGSKKVYVLINATAQAKTHLNTTPVADFEKNYTEVALACANSGSNVVVNTSADKVAAVSGAAEKIMMTNVEAKSINVLPNVTAADAVANPAQNQVAIEVERAVARVLITTD